jgi:hypothetical protein
MKTSLSVYVYCGEEFNILPLYFNIILIALKASSYSLDSAPLTFFPSFIILTSFCLLIVGVEDYRCTLSHSVTHTHTHTHTSTGLYWTSDRSVAETSLPSNTQHSHERDIHTSGGIRMCNIYIYVYIYVYVHTCVCVCVVYQIAEAVKRS